MDKRRSTSLGPTMEEGQPGFVGTQTSGSLAGNVGGGQHYPTTEGDINTAGSAGNFNFDNAPVARWQELSAEGKSCAEIGQLTGYSAEIVEQGLNVAGTEGTYRGKSW